jgi:ribosome-binding protein aMBF1 (putative translation factor)
MEEFIGECEVCGRAPRGLRVVVIYGLDTFACHECLGDDSDATESRTSDDQAQQNV